MAVFFPFSTSLWVFGPSFRSDPAAAAADVAAIVTAGSRSFEDNTHTIIGSFVVTAAALVCGRGGG